MPRLSVGQFSSGGKLARVGRQVVVNARKQLRVGILENATYMGDTDVPVGTPVASIAAQHEYGGGLCPPRPFLAPTSLAKKHEWIAIFKRLLRGKLVNGDVAAAMEIIGQTAVADVTDTIESMTSPALAKYTVEKKRERGRVNPEKLLVDSGTMEEAVSFDIQNQPVQQGGLL